MKNKKIGKESNRKTFSESEFTENLIQEDIVSLGNIINKRKSFRENSTSNDENYIHNYNLRSLNIIENEFNYKENEDDRRINIGNMFTDPLFEIQISEEDELI